MKTLFFALLILSTTSFNVALEIKNIIVNIKTSSECDDCKERIETALNNSRGVKYAELNVKTKVVTVKFNPKKTTLDKVKTIISNTGYAADDLPANINALNNLPLCCQPGGMK